VDRNLLLQALDSEVDDAPMENHHWEDLSAGDNEKRLRVLAVSLNRRNETQCSAEYTRR